MRFLLFFVNPEFNNIIIWISWIEYSQLHITISSNNNTSNKMKMINQNEKEIDDNQIIIISYL